MKTIVMKLQSLILIFLIFILNPTYLQAKEKFSISTFVDVDAISIAAERVLREAYKSLSIDIEIKHYPGMRSLWNANEGITDGELFRIEGIDQKYDNLRRISVPITWADQVVFTKNIQFLVKGWQSLKPYRIGHVKGVILVENNTKGMDVDYFRTTETEFRALAQGRIDIIVEDRFAGLLTLRQLNIKGVRILEPPITRVTLYHYINKKHQHLVPKLEKALRQMKKHHEIEKINNDVREELLKLK